MLKIDHLDEDALRTLLSGARLDTTQAFHVQTCANCRRRLGLLALRSGLFATPADGDAAGVPRPARARGGHLSARQVSLLHKRTLEREDLPPEGLTEFVAAIRHVARCEDCYARFFGLHESLSAPVAAIDAAVASFDAGQRTQRGGVLSIRRSLHELRQVFLAAPGAASSQDVASESPSAAELAAIALGAAAESGRRAADLTGADVRTRFAQQVEDLGEALDRLEHQRSHFRAALRYARTQARSVMGVAAISEQLARLRASVVFEREKLQRLEQSADDLAARARDLARADEEFRSRRYHSNDVTVKLGRLILILTTTWCGDDGVISLTARDADNGTPMSGVSITAENLAVVRAEIGPEAVTDIAGAAEVRIGRTTSRLEVKAPILDKPWLISVSVEEHGPLN